MRGDVVAGVLSVAWIALCAPGSAQTASPWIGHQVMVIRWDAKLGTSTSVLHTADLGEVFTVGRVSGPFLWIPRRQAWIHQDNVLPTGQAIDHFSALVDQDATARAYHDRAIAWNALSDSPRAIEDFDTVLRLEPSNAAAYTNRGLAWQRRGDLQRAIADYTRAIRFDPDDAAAFSNRSAAWMQTGEIERAMEDADSAIRLDPLSASAHNNRGVLWRERGDLQRAVQDYNSAIRLDPQHAAAYGNRAFAQAQRGQYDQANSDYRTALKLEPESPGILCDLAWLLATCPDDQIRDGTSAIEHGTRACRLTEFRAGPCLESLAAAYAETGRFEEAVRWAAEAPRFTPQSQQQGPRRRLELYKSRQPFRDAPAGE